MTDILRHKDEAYRHKHGVDIFRRLTNSLNERISMARCSSENRKFQVYLLLVFCGYCYVNCIGRFDNAGLLVLLEKKRTESVATPDMHNWSYYKLISKFICLKISQNFKHDNIEFRLR